MGADYIGQLQDSFNVGGISGIASEIGKVGADIVNQFASVFPKIAETGADLVVNFCNGISDNVSQASGAVWDIVKAIGTQVPRVMGAIAKMLGSILTALISEIVIHKDEVLGTIGTAISEVVTAVAKFLDENLGTIALSIIQGITDLVGGAVVYMYEHQDDIIYAMMNIFKTIRDKYNEYLPVIQEAFVKIITEVIPMILLLLGQVAVALIGGLLAMIIQDLAELEKQIKIFISNIDLKASVAKVIDGLTNAIANLIIKVYEKVTEIGEKIKEKFASIDLRETGKNIIMGLVQGIGDSMSAVVNKMKEVGSRIKNGINNNLDIHSPSRALMWTGEMITKGLTIGIEDGYPEVSQASSGMGEQVTKVIKEDVSRPTAPTSRNIEISIDMSGMVNKVENGMSFDEMIDLLKTRIEQELSIYGEGVYS